MTQICKSITNDMVDITILGHCDAGRINGMDLCCCAVSILTYTLMEALGKMKLSQFKSSYGGGWCHIRFGKKSKDYNSAIIAINTIMKGFSLLERSYPTSVNIVKEAIA